MLMKLTPEVDFTNMFTSIFYLFTSQKRNKDRQSCLLGSSIVKGAHKMKMKLMQGLDDVYGLAVRSRRQQHGHDGNL